MEEAEAMSGKPSEALTVEEFAEVRLMLEAGDSKRAIARHFGISRHVLARYLAGDNIPTGETIEKWVSYANCGKADLRLFVYGGKRRTLAQHKARFLEAKSYCDTCPVARDCIIDSSSEDRAWTVRGGLMPTQLRVRLANAK